MQELNSNFTLEDCLFGSVESATNADLDKYLYSDYGNGFDLHSEFSLLDGIVGKNIFCFGVDMGSSVHLDHKGKDILIFGKDPTQKLDDTVLSAEAQYSINFPRSNRKFCLSLHF